jgi:hypothetical protein
MAKKIKKNSPEEAAKELARAKSNLRKELAMDEEGVDRKLSPLAIKKREKRKKNFKRVLLSLVAFVVFYMFYWLVKPFESSMQYGICKVFVELNVPYPDTVYFSEVVEFQDSIRVWFSYSDSFGEFRLEPIQCYFGPSEKYGMELTRITIGRREIDPNAVASFNSALPAILANPPTLVYPTPLPNDPANLQINTDAYRRKIF